MKQYFTVIEMVIVVAILTIIISLLQPSFKQMLSSAHTVECLSKQHKIGAALMLYADDNDGFLPTLRNPYQLMGKIRNTNQIASHRKLNPYLGNNPEASHCPADIGDVVYGIKKNDSCYDAYGSSYNPAQGSTRSGVVAAFKRDESMNIYQIDPASNKFLLADWPWGKYRDAEHAETRRHGGDVSRVLNILFADGHAATTDFTLEYELNKLTMKPNKNWLWW